MNMLLEKLDRAPQLNAKSVLGTSGLWQRLAFQYRYQDELTHRDIQDRTDPPASLVAYSITLGMLNVWLSNGRLLTQLARAFRDSQEELDQ
jgi:hypothetical protein